MLLKFGSSTFINVNGDGYLMNEFLREYEAHVVKSLPKKQNLALNISIVKELNLESDQSHTYISNLFYYNDKEAVAISSNGSKLLFASQNTIIVEADFSISDFTDIFEHFLFNILQDSTNEYFLHASAIKYRERVLVFAGFNNTGKTKVLLQFLEKDAYVLGDDWVIMNDKGYVFPYYRRIRLYENDLANIPIKLSGVYPNFIFDKFKDKNRSLKKFFSSVYLRLLRKLVGIPIHISFNHKLNKFISNDAHKCDELYYYCKYSDKKITNTKISSAELSEIISLSIKNENQKVQNLDYWLQLFPEENFPKRKNPNKKKIMKSVQGINIINKLCIPYNANFQSVYQHLQRKQFEKSD